MSIASSTRVPRWGRIEIQFAASRAYADPFREVSVVAQFSGPSGETHQVDAFWDGGNIWRVRFSPKADGQWTVTTRCSQPADAGLHASRSEFLCTGPQGGTAFERHGSLRLSDDRRHLVHEDGTPFFWMADTAWNGPLLATEEEWAEYLRERVRQKFSAVQWVATQWLAAPDGDREGEKAFSGVEKITINPAFFQRLDERIDATTRAGLLNIPVLLWAAAWSTPEENEKNPGIFLPEDQAVLLARYMVARWSASPVVWILAGDADYRGEKAERWRRIGRAVFQNIEHGPVLLHPAGMLWPGDELRDESWLNLIGYQSGHGDDQATLDWLVQGPPAIAWKSWPARPVLNLEPPYEDHVGYHSQKKIDAGFVRRAMYWSTLVSPTAGVSYGAHGVWGWDDGTTLTAGHPGAGLPQHWKIALRFPGAEQVRHLVDLFAEMDWWKVQPAPSVLLEQPGAEDRGAFVTAAQSPDKYLTVVYVPRSSSITLVNLPDGALKIFWFNPRDGTRSPATQTAKGDARCFTTPGPGDWVLVLSKAKSSS